MGWERFGALVEGNDQVAGGLLDLFARLRRLWRIQTPIHCLAISFFRLLCKHLTHSSVNFPPDECPIANNDRSSFKLTFDNHTNHNLLRSISYLNLPSHNNRHFTMVSKNSTAKRGETALPKDRGTGFEGLDHEA